ncbi:hypothetical protein [Halodesulfovibrio sp.]|nr:hypothetical protein [Halodesulfovibrio sp.]
MKELVGIDLSLRIVGLLAVGHHDQDVHEEHVCKPIEKALLP